MRKEQEKQVENKEEQKREELVETLLQAPRPKKASPSLWHELGMLALKVTALGIALIAIFSFVYGFYPNADPDMAPMVKSGDLVLFYRLDRDYNIGDLLLVDFQGQRQVRRVVAKAGDTVDFIDGSLVINGAMQQEPEIYQQSFRYENGPEFPLTVEEGQVFVLGDSRNGATDSRVYGAVDRKNTLGTVITIIRRRSF